MVIQLWVVVAFEAQVFGVTFIAKDPLPVVAGNVGEIAGVSTVLHPEVLMVILVAGIK